MEPPQGLEVEQQQDPPERSPPSAEEEWNSLVKQHKLAYFVTLALGADKIFGKRRVSAALLPPGTCLKVVERHMPGNMMMMISTVIAEGVICDDGILHMPPPGTDLTAASLRELSCPSLWKGYSVAQWPLQWLATLNDSELPQPGQLHTVIKSLPGSFIQHAVPDEEERQELLQWAQQQQDLDIYLQDLPDFAAGILQQLDKPRPCVLACKGCVMDGRDSTKVWMRSAWCPAQLTTPIAHRYLVTCSTCHASYHNDELCLGTQTMPLDFTSLSRAKTRSPEGRGALWLCPVCEDALAQRSLRPTAINPAFVRVRGGMTGLTDPVMPTHHWREWVVNGSNHNLPGESKPPVSKGTVSTARMTLMQTLLQLEEKYRQQKQQQLIECFRAAPEWQQPGGAEAEVQRLLQGLPPVQAPAAPPADGPTATAQTAEAKPAVAVETGAQPLQPSQLPAAGLEHVADAAAAPATAAEVHQPASLTGSKRAADAAAADGDCTTPLSKRYCDLQLTHLPQQQAAEDPVLAAGSGDAAAGPSRWGPGAPTPTPPAPIGVPKPISGRGGLDLSKLAAGDWRLPEWTHLSQAGKALLDLLDKAGSPAGLLKQLREGMTRLKGLQRLMGSGTAELCEFEESYRWLQICGKKRSEAEGSGMEGDRTQWTTDFEATLRDLIEGALGPTDP